MTGENNEVTDDELSKYLDWFGVDDNGQPLPENIIPKPSYPSNKVCQQLKSG
jgi:hypothetical protein